MEKQQLVKLKPFTPKCWYGPRRHGGHAFVFDCMPWAWFWLITVGGNVVIGHGVAWEFDQCVQAIEEFQIEWDEEKEEAAKG